MSDGVLSDVDELCLAAQRGDRDTVEELLRRGIDPNAFDESGDTALAYAAAAEQFDVVKLLLAHGADVNAQDESKAGDTALGKIAARCSLAMATLLVDAFADPTIRGAM
jgi:ankyrin repeat protein